MHSPAALYGFDMRGAVVAAGVMFVSLTGCGGAGPSGVELRFRAPAAARSDDARIVRERLARLGLAGASVARAGDGLVVRAPGVDPSAGRPLARLLAADSPLRFYDWEADVVGPGCRPAPADTSVTGGAQAGSAAFGLTRAEAQARAAGCPETIVVRARGAASDRWYVLRDRPALTGAAIRHPKPFRDDGATGTGESKVTFDFTAAGVRAWSGLTRAVARRDRRTAAAGGDPQHVAIVLDATLLSTPSIAYRDFPDGIDARFGSQIDGGLTERSARSIAMAVTAGALPAPMALEDLRPLG